MYRKPIIRRLSALTAAFVLVLSGCAVKEETGQETETKKPALEIMDDEAGDLLREAEQKLQVHEEKQAELIKVSDIQKNPKDYTVMVYIIGSDLESRGGQATKDIEEMKQSGLDYEKTNLLLYTGGARRWVSDIPNDQNCVIDMSKDEAVHIMANTESTADMGSPETLREFVNFCTENYPAEHYGLILWDHGGGPLWGYGSDQLYENDSLILKELKKAMEGTAFSSGKKLDFIGFDACLMGTAETANLWKEYADYFVASEELEPGGGWDYGFLEILNHTNETESVVKEIVEKYGESIEEAKSEYFNPEYTLSAIRLDRMDNVIQAVDGLAERMQEEIEGGRYSYIRKTAKQAREFGRGHGYDVADLCDLAERLSERYPEEAEAVISAVEEAVSAKTGNIKEAGGLSIYIPTANRDLLEAAEPFKGEETELSETYGQFMKEYEERFLSGGREDWQIAKPEISGDEIVLQLTEEQADGATAYVSFLIRYQEAYFSMATIHNVYACDENGVVHIPADPYLVSMETESGSMRFPVRCAVTASSEEGEEYNVFSTYALSGMEFLRDFINIAGERISFKIFHEKGNDECVIRDIVTDTDSVHLDGKGSVDISNYESIGEYLFGYLPERDEDGNLLPFMDWQNRNWAGMNTLPADEGIRFRMRRASEFHMEMICQVLLQDSSGNLYASEYIDLPQKTDENSIQTETGNGILTFDVYDDHAELVDYKGSDSVLEIPEEAGGKPVTVIGSRALEGSKFEEAVLPEGLQVIDTYAFSWCPDLKKTELPDSLKEIGDYAFISCRSLQEIEFPAGIERIGRGAMFDCDLRTVVLPEGLKDIGRIPFAENTYLREILISEKNNVYQSKEGVLYSKDGKELIQYPNARGETYAVAEGTERIAYGAFAAKTYEYTGSDEYGTLQEIAFPASLKEIGNMAFFNRSLLREISFPENLERIGDFAFGAYAVSVIRLHLDSSGTICIPAKVGYIGKMAFAGLLNTAFEVDEKNRYYASSGGFITNKHKDTLLMMPSGMGNVISVPEGITTISELAFYDAEEEAHFVIPDSVFRFPKETFPTKLNDDTDEFEYYVKLHCSEGSAAEAYAEEYGIEYDNDMTGVLEEVRTVVIPSGSADLVFRVSDSRAVLVNTVGENEDLIIPETVHGVPVTELREESSYNSKFLKKHFQTIVIPASVKTIDSSFLFDIDGTRYEVSAGNENYSVRDGVLFDISGKELLKYPNECEETEYEIPAGTEVIGIQSFTGYYPRTVRFADSVKEVRQRAFMRVEKVQFNEGLKIIGDYAFSSCMKLNEVILPDSLEEIGRKAFDLRDTENPTVKIPDHLKMIEDNAIVFKDGYLEEMRLDDLVTAEFPMFPGLTIGRYAADEANPNLRIVEGMLLTEDGSGLCAVPSGWEGACYVPAGVELIDRNALYGCTGITDLYVPGSVVWMADSLPLNENGEPLFTVHCPADSETARELSRRNLNWVPWDGRITNE